ncbi:MULTISPECIES: DoxX family protein [unclassified Nocardiopsis]|uniref:DoxX family protein n=1 Tax=unclassified Nocardiopsis TaxID=2649073 RepID=UPI00135A05F8|nr:MULTISPECIES: DoxX family protein [unclassified Nocardiopsis]
MQRAKPRPGPVLRISRGRLYDIVATCVRGGTGWAFAEYGLTLRGREASVGEHLLASGLGALAPFAFAVPALLVSLSLAFAVGLLTWLTGPLLGAAAVLGALAAGSPAQAPFSSWTTTLLVTAVCLLMAVSGGRWSWDHLVLSPGAAVRHRRPRRTRPGRNRRNTADSPRRPEHAPPLLYPVGQAALRRPYRL